MSGGIYHQLIVIGYQIYLTIIFFNALEWYIRFNFLFADDGYSFISQYPLISFTVLMYSDNVTPFQILLFRTVKSDTFSFFTTQFVDSECFLFAQNPADTLW